jgi:protocatechuate 3,4-dioxygenase beta subunit
MGNHDQNQRFTLGRREALVAVGSLGAGVLWEVTRGANAVARVRPAPPVASTAAACVLSPEVTEGPYWIANHLTRRNITEGRAGLPLALHITVIHAASCRTVHDADVELWHTDATGTYSGVLGNTQHFLRGHQKSDTAGRVLFNTIYPGWYSGRTPHIHLKVHVGGSFVHTGQLFFSDPISDAVYRAGAYRNHGQPDTTNRADMIYAQAGGSRALVHLSKRAGHPGYAGQITVGVAA